MQNVHYYILIPVVLFGILHTIIADKPLDNPYSIEKSSFDFSSVSTIGFIPTYWLKSGKIRKMDESAEKQIYGYLKRELELKGYIVSYVKEENIKSIEQHGVAFEIEFEDLGNYPDLVLYANYLQNDSRGFYPMQSYEGTNWGNGVDSGGKNNRASSRNKTYLEIKCFLWAGKPDYSQRIWRGEILEISDKPDLNEKAEMMIQRLFSEQFKHRSNISSKPN